MLVPGTRAAATRLWRSPDTGRRAQIVLLAFAVLLIGASCARAGTYPMYQCTASDPSVSAGWTAYSYDSDASTVLSNNCSSADSLGDYVFSNGQAGAVTENGDSGSQVGLALEVPASAPAVTIQSLSATVAASGVSGDDAFLGFASAGQNLPGGIELPYGSSANYVNDDNWTLPEGARNFDAYVNCSTDHSSPTCYFANAASVPALQNITLMLADDTPPNISSISGALANAAAAGANISGSQTISFSAHDPDSGVLSATLALTPQEHGSPYSHTFDFSGECSYDSWNACPLNQTVGNFTLNTAELQDGNYTVSLTVTDAAGNVTTQTLGTVNAQNAPQDLSAPTILTPGQVLVGTSIDATPGEWSAPSEAGSISYSYQWQQCDSQGEDCQSIASAQSSSYSPNSQDVGDTLRVSVTASDRDGHQTALSAPSDPVLTDENTPITTLPGPTSPSSPTSPATPNSSPTSSDSGSSASSTTGGSSANASAGGAVAPASTAAGAGTPNGSGASETVELALSDPLDGARAYSRSAVTLSGRLDGRHGPIVGANLDILTQDLGSGQTVVVGHARTSANGTFSAHVPAGASRRITLAYRAFSNDAGYSTQASISESVQAAVALHISPRHTRPNGVISLSGHVTGPLPANGVIVELLVHYLGHWEPFRTPRTNSQGYFRVSYQFQGARGYFPFRAEVPSGQAGLPYSRGYSNIVGVSSG
ncbi:MAG TPA: Ig-like domain-containing protein [Solirubrobacteraceae bacterium]|nr:Ig-like domain-containing protein [Solirubrobacteraceae bacterium]